MAIEAKRQETLKLKEYIIMEKEKLEDAQKIFEEDKDKFHKYLNDMEQQADKAKENNDHANKAKQEYNDKLDYLQAETHKYEREIF